MVSAGAYTTAVSLWFIFHWGGTEHRALVSDVSWLLVNALPTLLAWRTSMHPALDRRTRAAWCLVGFAHLAAWIGSAIWFYNEIILAVQPFPSWSDAGYVAFYPLMLTALLLFPTARRGRAEWLKLGLDVATVLVGAGTAIWYFLLRPTLLAEQGDTLASALALAYPTLALVLLLGSMTLSANEALERSRGALRILAASIGVYVCFNVLYGYLSLQGVYESGNAPDILYLVANVGIALSAHYQYRRAAAGATPPAVHSETAVQSFSLLPYAAVAVEYALLVAVSRDQAGESLHELVIGAVVLTSLVVARQVIALRENARLHAERAIRRSEARFRSMVQRSSDIVTIVEADSTISYQSPSIERLFGYRSDEFIGRRLLDFVHPDDARRALAFLVQATTRPEDTTVVEWRLRHRDGSWRHVETVSTNLLADPTVRGVVLNSRDVTERKALEHQLAHQAFHDGLTGLPNRALFHNRVAHALAKGERTGERVAVLFLDLDNFKAINDSFGHAVGDRVLLAAADRLRICVRPGDTVARFGGDEFAILIDDLSADADTSALAARILEALRKPLELEGREVRLEASIGIAVAELGESRPEEMLRNADVAMYAAKGRGKGRCEMYEPRMHTAVVERLEAIADLRQAIERDQFVLLYQPIVSLASGQITALEALVRWHHPQRGMVLPADFIPLAEETGLILPLGRRVLKEACRRVHAWQQHWPDAPLSVSVNLSARQFQQAQLIDEVAAALAESGLAPGSLILEITESMMMEDLEAVIARLRELKALGVWIAVDDFGTGYSSLSYLQRFPLDILKVDRSFVSATSTDNGQSVVLETIVALGKMLGLQTVAEGIELPEQLERLQALACDQGQGYYFARPLGPEAVEALLQRDREGDGRGAGRQGARSAVSVA